MAKKQIEVDETQYVSQQNLAAIMIALEADPRTKKKLYEMVKEVKPEVRIPELEVMNETQGQISALETKLDKFLTAQQERDVQNAAQSQTDAFTTTWNKQKQALLDKGCFPSVVKEIEELAQREGISNFNAAAAYYEQLNPPSIANPRGSMFTDFEGAQTDDAPFKKRLMESMARSKRIDEGAVNGLIQNALNDVRAQNRRVA